LLFETPEVGRLPRRLVRAVAEEQRQPSSPAASAVSSMPAATSVKNGLLPSSIT